MTKTCPSCERGIEIKIRSYLTSRVFCESCKNTLRNKPMKLFFIPFVLISLTLPFVITHFKKSKIDFLEAFILICLVAIVGFVGSFKFGNLKKMNHAQNK